MDAEEKPLFQKPESTEKLVIGKTEGRAEWKES